MTDPHLGEPSRQVAASAAPGRNQRSRTGPRGRIHPASAALVDPLHGHGSAARAAGRSSHTRSCRRRTKVPPGRSTRRTSSQASSSARGARCSKTSTAMTASKLAGPEGQPPRRPAHAIQPRLPRAGEHRRGEVQADHAGASARPGSGRTAPCRNPGRGCDGRRAGRRLSTMPSSRGSSSATSGLNRACSASKRAATIASLRVVVDGDHVALLARVSSRCFQARTAAETPENRQNMNPSTPSRNPCLKT